MASDYSELQSVISSGGFSQDAAFSFFSSLQTADEKSMIGTWRGRECPSGHELDGLLTAAPWHGKRFDSSEKVHPLVMDDQNGVLYTIDPRRVFGLLDNKLIYKMILSISKNALGGVTDPHKYDALMKLFRTKKYCARLRMLDYKGIITAAMIYDELPIIDIFKKLDDNHVMGLMDIKGKLGENGYFFLLEREP